jgi:hypothetical protein
MQGVTSEDKAAKSFEGAREMDVFAQREIILAYRVEKIS